MPVRPPEKYEEHPGHDERTPIPPRSLFLISLPVSQEQTDRRYHRQMLLPDWGEDAQRRIREARVLVIGAGGLGSPVLLYLTAAGVGTIGIVEYDCVEETNLHRQILFRNSDIGRSKASLAAQRLHEQNPDVAIEPHEVYLTAATALDIFSRYDIVVDGSDNLPTRYLVNDACVLAGKVLVSGAVYRMEGQVSVFHQLLADGSRSADYRDLFPEPPPASLVPACGEAGVLGPLVGWVGTIMAVEVLKLITGTGETLHGRLMVMDASDSTTRIVRYGPRADRVPLSGLIDYESFCDRMPPAEGITELTPTEAHARLAANKLMIVDVREPDEFKRANIGGVNLPLGQVVLQAYRIPKQIQVMLVCKSGNRSVQAIRKLEDAGFSNLVSLRGGLDRWRAEVDGSLPAC